MNFKAYNTKKTVFDIKNAVITFLKYPYPKKKTRIIYAGDITEITMWYPPVIRLRTDEYLFVSREHIDELKTFAEYHAIPIINREDLWSYILDPFLDTQLGEDHYTRTSMRLNDSGVSPEEVKSIRKRLHLSMMVLTFMTWEWVHYGLDDALAVSQPAFGFQTKAWTQFYARAMEIACNGVIID